MLPFLNPGRLLKVIDELGVEWGWGVLMNYQKKSKASAENSNPARMFDDDFIYILDVLVFCTQDMSTGKLIPSNPVEGTLEVIPMLLQCVDQISAIRTHLPKNDKLKPKDRDTIAQSLKEINHKFSNGGIPLLDVIEDMKIKDLKLKQLLIQIENSEDALLNHELNTSSDLENQFSLYQTRLDLETQLSQVDTNMKALSHNIVFRQNLKNMKRVLRRLDLITSENIVDLKGRVACEITTCDELVGTELLFNGSFNDLTPEQIVAIMSCLIFSEGGNSRVIEMTKEVLAIPLRLLQDTVKYVGSIMAESKMAVDTTAYVNSFRPDLMEVAYEWAKGAKFADVCKLTEVYEGSIIRAMRRLEELIGEFSSACKLIGNVELLTKFQAAGASVKRDIIFANSLYL